MDHDICSGNVKGREIQTSGLESFMFEGLKMHLPPPLPSPYALFQIHCLLTDRLIGEFYSSDPAQGGQQGAITSRTGLGVLLNYSSLHSSFSMHITSPCL